MSDYIIKDGELYHYGIPGMRWGHKKGPGAVQTTGNGRRGAKVASDKPSDDQTKNKPENDPAAKAAKKAKAKKAVGTTLAVIGATAVTALFAAGVAKGVKRKRSGLDGAAAEIDAMNKVSSVAERWMSKKFK